MKLFHYHREFWLDFHFWLLVLLFVAVAMMTQDPLSVVSLAYLAFVGILILLQVFQPQNFLIHTLLIPFAGPVHISQWPKHI